METTVITLPCTKSIAAALLEYFYTDTLQDVSKEQDLFKLIILADQLFITRLKEQCEYLLFLRLSLKNCVECLIFADIYNATQLKSCCLKYITLNMVPLLEVGKLDDVDENLLKELNDFYFENKPHINCRVITPYSTAASEEEVLSISSAYPISSLEETREVVQKVNLRKKLRYQKVAVDNQKIKIEESDNNIIQFPDSPSDSNRDGNSFSQSTPSRIRVIQLTEDQIAQDDYVPHFTKLISKNFTDEEDFPLLNSFSCPTIRSPHKYERHKITKISQKERKRISSESSTHTDAPESPKNPWKSLVDVESPPLLETSMDHIIFSEKKQKVNLVKMKSKLLKYTQMEDKAIEELMKFYNVDITSEEFITVERVDMGAFAAPMWVPGGKKMAE